MIRQTLVAFVAGVGLLTASAGTSAASRPVLASTDGAGHPANRDVDRPALSSDGRWLAFLSRASNLVPGANDKRLKIFLKDLQTGSVELVSVAKNGKSPNAESGWPSVSGNGRFVAFPSQASNLVSNDTNERSDVFVRDVYRERTERVSVQSDGSEMAGGAGIADISQSGRLVSFPGGGPTGMFIHDRRSGVTEPVRVRPQDGSRALLVNGLMSGDGRYVAARYFNDDYVRDEIWVLDRTIGIQELASVSNTGTTASQAYLGDISADGRSVVFQTGESLDGRPDPAPHDCYVRDLAADVTERISVSTSGNVSRGECVEHDISGDGDLAVFVSYADRLTPGDRDDRNRSDVFLRDRRRGRTLSLSATAGDPRYGFHDPAISDRGNSVVFEAQEGRRPDQVWSVRIRE